MDSQWLKTQFELNPEKSKAGLARALGLDPPAISKILKGTRQIKAQEYATMRRYFGLSVEGDGLRSGANHVISKLAPGVHMHEEGAGNNEEGWIIPAEVFKNRTDTPPEKIKIFKVQESLMEPDFRYGENVLVDLSDTKPPPPGIFVVSDGFSFFIRQCEYTMKSELSSIRVSANTQSFSSQILKESDFDIVGRVIAKLQWL